MSEPMNDERLAEVAEWVGDQLGLTGRGPWANAHDAAYIRDLFAEVERLRVETDTLAQEVGFHKSAYQMQLATAEMWHAQAKAMRAMVVKLSSLWIMTDDSHAPARRISLFSERDLVDVEALREEAREFVERHPAMEEVDHGEAGAAAPD